MNLLEAEIHQILDYIQNSSENNESDFNIDMVYYQNEKKPNLIPEQAKFNLSELNKTEEHKIMLADSKNLNKGSKPVETDKINSLKNSLSLKDEECIDDILVISDSNSILQQKQKFGANKSADNDIKQKDASWDLRNNKELYKNDKQWENPEDVKFDESTDKK